jgi:hypothetical protein
MIYFRGSAKLHQAFGLFNTATIFLAGNDFHNTKAWLPVPAKRTYRGPAPSTGDPGMELSMNECFSGQFI